MKTVLLVDHHGVRGYGRRLYRLLADERDIRYVLVVPAAWPDGFTLARAEREESVLEVIPLATLFAGKPHRAVYRGLTALILRERPAVLYVDGEPESFLALQAVRAACRASSSVAVVFDSWRNIDYGPSEFPIKFPRLAAAIERRVLRHAAHGIVHNNDAAAIFQRKGFAATAVIPPWVDTEHFRIQPARRGTGGQFVVGYVGRLVPEKGVETLVRALATLPERFRLLVAGEGPQRASLQRLAESLSVGPRVEWGTGVAQAALPELYGRMDALVLPSLETPGWKEQFGRVLIEAMACGVPVLGARTGEIPAVIGECGFVFPAGDSGALSRMLLHLEQDPELRSSLRERARERVVRHFDLRVVAELTSRLFRSLLAEHPASS